MRLLQLRFLYITLLFTLLVLINNGLAQDLSILGPNQEIIETVFNNRSIAMGKTTITTPRGSSAIFSNPSILATFPDPQVQLGGKLLFGTTIDEAESEDYEFYESNYVPFPNRSYLAFAVPYRLSDTQLKLVFGIGYQRNEGVKTESEGVKNLITSKHGVFNRVTSNMTVRRYGPLSSFTPGVALNFQNRYFLGATFNRTLGAIINRWETRISNSHVKIDSETEQSALLFRLGALAEVTPELSIGLIYRPEFEWELGKTIVKRYTNGELETERNSGRIELTIPTIWGIGAEYKVFPELIVALEMQSRPFSELQWSWGFDEQPIIDDGFNFSVGAEYLGSAYPVRFGAFRDVIPFVDEDDTTPVNLIGLTAGIGSDRDKDFSWAASGLYSRWERVVNDEGQKYSENLIRASISVTYHFNTN